MVTVHVKRYKFSAEHCVLHPICLRAFCDNFRGAVGHERFYKHRTHSQENTAPLSVTLTSFTLCLHVHHSCKYLYFPHSGECGSSVELFALQKNKNTRVNVWQTPACTQHAGHFPLNLHHVQIKLNKRTFPAHTHQHNDQPLTRKTMKHR